ncbi:hypothetical protein [Paraburkholderia unamae]|uniref:Uncharacterized protein n=1 Tax=Paraburkholderia unamae TaxID=219649 RepID=A0ACC6RGP7_9BURK
MTWLHKGMWHADLGTYSAEGPTHDDAIKAIMAHIGDVHAHGESREHLLQLCMDALENK